MKGKIADGEARERLIIWIRRRMDEFGITRDALAASIQQDLDQAPIYRDTKGNGWNGLGEMPDWLKAARNAGVDPAFFRIEEKRGSPVDGAASRSDPRQLDLFSRASWGLEEKELMQQAES